MRFALFLVVNAMLFIRPAEFFPALLDQPIYEVCILACLAVSYASVAAELSPRRLLARPINACVLGMFAAILLASLSNGETTAAWEYGVEFVKLLLYYLLLVSVVDTPARLDRLLTALAAFAAVITAFAVLQYHHVIALEAIEFVKDLDGLGGDEKYIARLGSTGLFSDPNDMCLMLVMAMTICGYQILERRRWYWAAPLALFGHALTLTHSRGGFLGMLAALVVLLLAKFGRKALPLGALVLPVMFVLFAGRQTSISLSGGTGQSRIQLWADGLALFLRRPIFGIGTGRYAELLGHVAHNSFIHCFVELGMFGGTLFLGAFYLSLWPLARLGGSDVPPLEPSLARMRPYVMAIVAGYAGGLMSLSCPYVIPTYTVLGLAAVFTRLAEDDLGVPIARLNRPLIQRLVALGLAFVIAAQIVVRVLVRYQ